MRNTSLTLLIPLSLIALLEWGCNSSTSSENPVPSRVQLVEKLPDTSIVELGIDAEVIDQIPPTNRNGILIQWHPVDDADLIAYDIYREEGDSIGTFTKIAESALAFGTIDTAYLDTAVQRQTQYFYYVIARDEIEQESDPSKKEWYTILAEPALISPTRDQAFNGLFEWEFSGLGAQHFIFRLERQLGDNVFPVFIKQFSIEGNVNTNQRWSLADLGISSLDSGTYRWRIDVVTLRDNREGAESNWETFEI